MIASVVPLRSILKHRRPYRTRIVFPHLKGREERCAAIRKVFSQLAGVDGVQVRSRSGSVILEHPRGPVSLATLLQAAASASLLPTTVPETAGPDGSGVCCSSRTAGKRQDAPRHVSGLVLATSGVYLLFLFARRLFVAALPPVSLVSRLLSLPALIALGLSLPIQAQAIEHLKQSGKPDMGLISTGLLYVSLLTGNVLATLTVFWLFNLSSWLEDRIRARTRRAVRGMLTGTCRRAWLIRNGLESEVDVDSLRPGDVIALRLGNVIPVDGVVISGNGLIDEAAMTGENDPAARQPGDAVLAGTVVTGGSLRVRVEKSGEDTRLAAIVRLIENAETDPGELQRASQRFSQVLAPISLVLAGLAFMLTGNLLQSMAVLIITCPCALRLSTSVAVSAAMSGAAARGILIKGGRYVEIAGRVNVVVLDKTGTLTDRSSEVTELIVVDRRYKAETMLSLAASAQQSWSHPLSRAVIEKAAALGLSPPPGEQPELVVGQGVRARVNGRAVAVGRAAFLADNGVDMGAAAVAEQHVSGGAAGWLYVACDGRLIGIVAVRNRMRGNVQSAVLALRALGVRRIVLLTGDHRDSAVETCGRFGFDETLWNQSPEDKAAWIAAWKRAHPGDVVAMVGDGVNDTPAFAAADLSVAVGDGGVDVTVEYADIVLQQGGLDQAAAALALGQRTLQTIKECYALALGLNGVTLALTTLGVISPVAGALIHNCTTVAAVVNAGSVNRRKGIGERPSGGAQAADSPESSGSRLPASLPVAALAERYC